MLQNLTSLRQKFCRNIALFGLMCFGLFVTDMAYAEIPVNHIVVPIMMDDIPIFITVPKTWSVPVGSPDPGPICSQAQRPKFAKFMCAFMTETLWYKAGQPKLDSNGDLITIPGIPGWQPEYYAGTDAKYKKNVGLLESMKYSVGPEARRYTPWSVRAQQKNTQMIIPMPWDNGGTLERYQLLAFGFKEYAADTTPGPGYPGVTYGDPTLSFEQEAFISLGQLVMYHFAKSSVDPQAVYELLVYGTQGGAVDTSGTRRAPRAVLFPDYGKDGSVLLANPNGTYVPLPTMASAAEYAAAYRLMFANGSINTFEDGKASALMIAQKTNIPVVYMYHAQNILYIDDISNNPFNTLWRELTEAASNVATLRMTWITQICHSNSCYKSALAAYPYSNINLVAINPAHMPPTSQPLWEYALKNALGNVFITTGGSDPLKWLGGSGGGPFGGGVDQLIWSEPNVEQRAFPGCTHEIAVMFNSTCGALQSVMDSLK